MAPPKRPYGNDSSKYTKRQRVTRDSSPSRPSRSLGRRMPMSAQTNMSKYQSGGGIEKKWVDIAQNAAFPSGTTTGTLTLLNPLSLGNTSNSRVGSRVEVKSVAIRGLFQSSATSIATPIRIKVVYDKESNGAAPVATDILTNDVIYGHNNLSNAGRFITLIDQIITPTFAPGVTAIGSGGSLVFDLFVKCNLPVKYNTGNAGTIADIVSGGIYMLTYQTGASTTPNNDEIITRVRYTDI